MSSCDVTKGTQVSANTPSQVLIQSSETASCPPCLCPLANMWKIQWSIIFSRKLKVNRLEILEKILEMKTCNSFVLCFTEASLWAKVEIIAPQSKHIQTYTTLYITQLPYGLNVTSSSMASSTLMLSVLFLLTYSECAIQWIPAWPAKAESAVKRVESVFAGGWSLPY